ncbi:MAG: serine/threonine-protein kinase [Polyangiaceae bacterium]
MSTQAVGRAGLVVGGRYYLEVLLGRGAMGEVWRARHVRSGSYVAIKLVHIGQDQELAARFMSEVRASAAIQSPYVVRIYEHGQDGPVGFFAMELLTGQTLAQRIKQGSLTPAQTALVVRHVSQGILAAHNQGIVHRDLKPENVFLARTTEGEVAKVLDFGVAKSLAGTGHQTQQGMVVGTPAYLSREQVLGSRPVDAHSDLWALAIIAYESFTGRLPYQAGTIAELFLQIVGNTREIAARSANLPPPFLAWFLRATNVDPEKRFQNARELSEALTLAIAPDLPATAWVELSAVRPAMRPPRKSKAWIWGVVGGLAAVAGITTVLAVREAGKASAKPMEPTASASPSASASAEIATASATVAASLPPVASSAPTVASVASGSASTPTAKPSTAASGKKRGYDRWGL